MYKLCVLLVAVILCAAAVPARADGPSKKEINAALDRALEAGKKGQHKQAISIFEKLLPGLRGVTRDDVHRNLAALYMKTKDLAAAWYHLDRYLVGSGSNDKRARKGMTRLEGALKKTHLNQAISCKPSGATFHPGNGYGYPCPLNWWYEAGKHKVKATKRDFQTVETELTVAKGSATAHSLVLKPRQRPAVLLVRGERGAPVLLDGKQIGTVPFRGELEPGEKQVIVGKAPGRVWKKTVTLVAGQSVTLTPPAVPGITNKKATPKKPKEKDNRLWQWTLVGGGVALAAVGGILQLVAYNKNEDLHTKYPADPSLGIEKCEQNQQDYSNGYSGEVKPLRAAAIALYSVGGVMVAGGTIWMFVDKPVKAQKKTIVQPWHLPGGAGLQLNLGF